MILLLLLQDASSPKVPIFILRCFAVQDPKKAPARRGGYNEIGDDTGDAVVGVNN